MSGIFNLKLNQLAVNIDKEEILQQLDIEAGNYIFPMLDNGYYYHGDQKLTIFRDETRWAMLLEVLAYNNHEYGIEGITLIANVFGNCLTGWNDNDSFYFFAENCDVETFLFDETNHIPYLNPEARKINVKGTEIPVQLDPAYYAAKGIVPAFEDKITPWELLRALVPDCSHLFWLTRQEISPKIPLDLPVFMTLDDWHHPDLAAEEMPSDTETFRQLAEVIATGDINCYNTQEPDNTHWRNWGQGGAL